ncbi:MAG: hypothetical protein COB05_17760 [Marinobacter sp.]|nr:MAG: hypothetical protein COB05_17760 [Marinobacter sp.]
MIETGRLLPVFFLSGRCSQLIVQASEWLRYLRATVMKLDSNHLELMNLTQNAHWRIAMQPQEIDRHYHNQALNALHKGFAGYEKLHHEGDAEVEPAEILRVFQFAGDILRSDQESERIRMVADTVFTTCIRLTRCVLFPNEGRTVVLNGTPYLMDASL